MNDDDLRVRLEGLARHAPNIPLDLSAVRRQSRRRRARRRLGGAGVLAAALVAAPVAWTAASTGGGDLLVPADAPTGPAPASPTSEARGIQKSPLKGELSRAQATRTGADGTRECSLEPVQAYVRELASEPSATRLVGAFLTDSTGYTRWKAEFSGLDPDTERGGGSEPGGRFHAVCWFDGAFTAPDDATGADGRPVRFVVVHVPVEDPDQSRVLATSTEPIGVLPPDKPTEGTGTTRDSVTPTQPEGVRVQDG